MILNWSTAFWLYLFFGLCIFLFFMLIVNRILIKRYGYHITYRKEYIFSIPSGLKLLYIFFSSYPVYLLWHNTQSIYLIEKGNSVNHKAGLFLSTLRLKNGDLIELENCETLIINNTKKELVYEAVEYVSPKLMELENAVPREIDYVVKDGIVRYKEKKDNRRSFVKIIYPYTSYNCSKIGVEYFFENAPPKEREDEPDLPFGNRDESVWNMRGWLRNKDFVYNNE